MTTKVLGGGSVDGQLGENPDWINVEASLNRQLWSVDELGKLSGWLVESTQEVGGQLLANGLYANPKGVVSDANVDNDQIVSNTKVIKSILVSEGLSGEYGYFADGFTINDPLDVGIDAISQFWKYVGTETLPYDVPQGTDPSVGDWELVRLNDHNNLTNRNAVGAHDAIYVRTVTLAEAQAEDAPLGTRYQITDFKGQPRFDVVGSADAGGFYYEGLASGRKLKLKDEDSFYAYGIENNNSIDQKDLLQTYADLANEFYIPENYNLSVASTVSVNHGRINVVGRLEALEGATFTGDEVLKIGSYNASQIGTLANSLSIGFSTVTIQDASTINVGDIVTIYNPADFSWSNHRSYYRQGEHLKVSHIVSSTKFRAANNIYDNYSSGLPVYALNAKKCDIKSLNVHAGESSAYAVTLESLRDGDVENLTCTGGRIATIHRNRCYNLEFSNPSSQQWYDDGSATNYAHYTLSCQNVVDINPNVRAFRHALTLTARDQELSIPNRNCGAIGGVATTSNSSPGVTALDFHGCTENCFYLDVEINGGVNIGGKNNKVRSDKIYQRFHTSCIYGSELVNTNHDYSDCTVITSLAGANSRGQWIDIGGNSGSLNSDTKAGGLLNFKNLKVKCLGNPTSTSEPIKITNRGYVGDDVDIDFDGITYLGGTSFTNWSRFVIGNVDSGSLLNSVTIKNSTLNYMAGRIFANNISTDGYKSKGSSVLSGNFEGLDLRIGAGILDLGDITISDTSLSPLSINGGVGSSAGVVVASSINCLEGNQSAGGTTEENSGFSVRSVDIAVLPEVNVISSSVDPAATLSVRINGVNKVVRGHWNFEGYATTAWSNTGSSFDDFSISEFKIESNKVPSATSLGTVTNRFEVKDQNGNSVGFVPIYDSIT